MISVEAPPAFSHPAPPAVPSSGWETLAPQIDLRSDQSGWYPLLTNPDGVTATAGEASFVDGEVVVLPPSIDPDAPLHIRIAGFAREAAVINGMDLPPSLHASLMGDLRNKYDLPGPREEGALPPASVGGANVVAAAAVVGHRAPGWFRALCATTALALGLSSCAPRNVPIGITAEPLPQPGLTQLPLETAPAPPTATGEQQSTATVEPLQIAYYGIRGAIPLLHAVDRIETVSSSDLPSSALGALEGQGYQPLAFIGADGKTVIAEVLERPQDGSKWCTVALPPERTAPDGNVDQLLTNPADAVEWPEAYAYAAGYGNLVVYEYGLPNGEGTADDTVTALAIAGVHMAGVSPEDFTCATLIVTDPEKTTQEGDFAGATYIGLVEKDTGKVTATVPMLYGPEANIIFDGNTYVVDGQTLAFSLSPDGTVTTTLGPATPEPPPFVPGTVTFEPQMFESALPAAAAETLDAIPGQFSRGWVDAETGQPVAIMYEDTATLDSRTVPMAKKYVFNPDTGAWQVPDFAVGPHTVKLIIPENKYGIAVDSRPSEARWLEFGRSIIRMLTGAFISSYQVAAGTDYSFTLPIYDDRSMQKAQQIQDFTAQYVAELEKAAGASGGVLNGRVGLMGGEQILDLSGVDVVVTFEDDVDFKSMLSGGETILRTKYLITSAEIYWQSETDKDVSKLGQSVSFAFMADPSGRMRLLVNVEPTLIQYWLGRLGEQGADAVVGNAIVSAAVGAGHNKTDMYAGGSSQFDDHTGVFPDIWYNTPGAQFTTLESDLIDLETP